MKNRLSKLLFAGLAISTLAGVTPYISSASTGPVSTADNRITDARFRSMQIQGIDIAYREAGDPSNPAIVLLHGFPTSSHMYRELITQLADRPPQEPAARKNPHALRERYLARFSPEERPQAEAMLDRLLSETA